MPRVRNYSTSARADVRFVPFKSSVTMYAAGPDDKLWIGHVGHLPADCRFLWLEPPEGWTAERAREHVEGLIKTHAYDLAGCKLTVRARADIPMIEGDVVEVPAEHGVRDIVREEALRLTADEPDDLVARVVAAAEQALSEAGL